MLNLLREQVGRCGRGKDRPDASDFPIIAGGRAYLIHSKTEFSWSVRGEQSIFSKINWQTNSFNLWVSMLRKNAGPSFEQFFKHSKSHKESPIYRLRMENGYWSSKRELN